MEQIGLNGELIGSYNEISLFLGVLVTILFFIQYRKYNYEMEREEMIDHFLEN